jgi:eukaryotic-like serine/threonine-protein kinase
MADRIGQHFGDYRLVRLIGQGDFGEVYLGEHLRHSGQAAIKVLHTRLRDVDALYFLNEERRIYNLKHPHVVRLLDYDFKDDIPFLIMDYLPNGTLRQRYPEGTLLPLADILSYVKQVADVLQYAHDKNLIHCGIKPENMLLLGRNNVVLLSDFCLPLIVRSSYSQGKQAMSIRTVNYLAPEQIQGHPGPASDQYALGIVVYEWINGARPFDGSSPEIIRKHLTMLPPPLRDKNPWLPNAIEQVVLTALAKNPKGRFPSVQDFANALEQAILSHPIDTSAPNLPLPFPPEFPIIPVSPHTFTRRDALR